MTKYNVIIIGAGPAGSYLAYKLKKQGISILLLEKQKFPRYKACAGGLSKKAFDIIFSENKNIENIVEKVVKKGLYVRNNRFTFVEPDKELVYMTYRSDLDNFLMKMAVDNKTVFFKDNVKIQKIDQKNNNITFFEKNKKHQVEYDILVGAWGSNIKLNKLVDIYPFKRFSVSSSWEGPSSSKFNEYCKDCIVTQIMDNYPCYVGYIFPKSELITAGLFRSKNPNPTILKNMWEDFVKFWDLDIKIKPSYAWIPVRDFNKSIARKNILLVGDAAGLTDPFTGEGIYYAFINGEIASKQILNYFKTRNYDLASEYNKNINLKLFNLIKWAEIYTYIFNHFPNFSFWFGSETTLGEDIIISLITGDIKYNEISKVLNYSIKNFHLPFIKSN
jgi:geranylgeranyl reductase family protein